MWNKVVPAIAAGRPAGNAAPPAAPPQAPAPAAAAPAGPPGQSPHPAVNGNVIGETLRDRAKSLTPQESQTFFDGITVPALVVLKKLIPEIGPAIDGAIQRKQTGQGHAPMPAPGQGPAPVPAPGAAPAPAPLPPRTGLSRI